ncbi:xanthine dehydrogenase family protein subunit M [Parasedimentitalea marina]|uniref:Xanthine dehydrogenase family protein subunit M n=1 Tax=Parasedimentitalea marina TaxID=2483033 RepID=A0A3T0N2U5_9RHOB|nr:xanthine dehydrogenase family protein subunit M [Parasedimentitalea marina]AZV78312.1 xanthine dehydrogenase family protein subunit M [Parasedimentitalea marina]
MQYHSPNSFEDAAALALAATGTTRFLAGGTDVLVQLRADIITPDTVIDIKNIPGTQNITCNADGSWTLGVATPGAEMREHAGLGQDWPGLVEAMDLIGSTQVQGRATLVGNLCNGSPAADSVPAMATAGVELSITNAQGTRRVPVMDIPAGPGRTHLTQGDVISAVHIPARGERGGDAYLRFIPRTEMDIAVVGCAVNLRLDTAGVITEASVSLGAVAPTVLVLDDAADTLIGSTLDDASLDRLAEAASAACNPISDKRGTIEFRTHVAGVLAKRAAKIAYARAQGVTK